MEAIFPMKQLIHRKQKHYKAAIGDHLTTLRKAIDRDTEQKLQSLDSRSIDISAPDFDNKTIQGFTVVNLPESRVDERVILVQLDTKQKVAEGAIVSVGQQEVKIKLDRPITIKNDENESSCSNASVFKVKFDKQDILDRKKRIENALNKFKHVSCSLPLHKSLLGNYKDWSNQKYGKARVISLSEPLKLKGAQVKAVEESMKKRISLIEGVAGSGKTLVAASLAYSMHRFREKKVLLCSPIQATVDKMAQMLHDTEKVLVVKLTEKKPQSNIIWRHNDNCSSKESSQQEQGNCSLESLVKAEIFKKGWRRTERISMVPKSYQHRRVILHRQATRVVSNSSAWLRKQMERKILREADIVCCTLVQAGSPYLRGIHFDILIIDDLQAATEPDCMIPMMVKGLKQVTLISEMRREIRSARTKRLSIDTKPMANGKSSPKKANGLKVAESKKQAAGELVVKQAQEPGGLFERWLSMGLTAVALRNQFRMHETLAAFSKHHFYLSRSKTDREANKELTRQICNNLELSDDRFNWLPNNKCLTAFFDTRTNESSVDETVIEIINKLTAEESVQKSRIGIITNERSETSQSLNGVEIGTIEDFRGQERDFIILLARDNTDAKKNFDMSTTTIDCDYLRDEDALLIAITRARLGQFIVTELFEEESSSCQNSIISAGYSSEDKTNYYCDSWKALVRYYLANKLVIHAPTSGLEQKQLE